MSDSATKRLPAAARDVLDRGDRNGNILTPSERERIAAALLDTGIQGAPNIAWMATLIRFRLGVGDRPTAPGKLTANDWAFQLAEQRAEQIARDLLAARKAAA